MLGTSFPQWRVLYATEQLVRQTPEGVSEQAVAARTDMDITNVSRLLHRLERKGLVDRGQEECAFTYYVLVTQKGPAPAKDSGRSRRRIRRGVVLAALRSTRF